MFVSSGFYIIVILCLSVFISRFMPIPRCGSVVLYHMPGPTAQICLGLVLSIWRRRKAPKLCSPEVPIKCCFAWRVTQLKLMDSRII